MSARVEAGRGRLGVFPRHWVEAGVPRDLDDAAVEGWARANIAADRAFEDQTGCDPRTRKPRRISPHDAQRILQDRAPQTTGREAQRRLGQRR